jgi:signal peptidase I
MAGKKIKSQTREQTQETVVEDKSYRRIYQEYAEAFVIAVVLAILIRALFFQAFKIPSGSMIPTLLIGDHILVNKMVYGVRIPFTSARWPRIWAPERGDVIVFVFPEDRTKDFIKRVVAVPGDTVEIKNKQVIINGKEVPSPRARWSSTMIFPAEVNRRDNIKPLEVPPGKLFVMGDNRDESHDSRFWGFVPIEDVKGKALVIYYSAPQPGEVWWDRLYRFFNIIR